MSTTARSAVHNTDLPPVEIATVDSSQPGANFFQIGGTLHADAPSYVRRRADDLLVGALRRHEVALVLAPRQSGKSSLMVRAWDTLRREGAQVAIIDLQSIGKETDRNKFFRSLAFRVEMGISLKTDVRDWWKQNDFLSPPVQFQAFLEKVVLPEIQGNVILFFDEIDSTLRLPFSDEFFTALRALYNARANQPELRRLTYALIGTASPAQFMLDKDRTPFNIGVEIPLDDFDPANANPFREVLGSRSEPLVNRVFYWSGGQPLLVQRFAKFLYDLPPEQRTERRLDSHVQETYLKGRVDSDTHLKFIQDYLLAKGENGGVAPVQNALNLYGRVLARKQVTTHRDDPAEIRLRLAGVVAVKNGLLVPRNQLYEQIFGLKWIEANLPPDPLADSPLRRWLDNDRSQDYLLRGNALREAESSEAQEYKTPEGKDFLFASSQLERREQNTELQRQNKRRQLQTAIIGALCIGMVLAGIGIAVIFKSFQAEKRSKEEANKSRIRADKTAKEASDNATKAEVERRKALAAEKRAVAARTSAERAQKAEKIAKEQVIKDRNDAVQARKDADRARGEAVAQAEKAKQATIAAQAAELSVDALLKLKDAKSVTEKQEAINMALSAVNKMDVPGNATIDSLTIRPKKVVDALRQTLFEPSPSARVQLRYGIKDVEFAPNGNSFVLASEDGTAAVRRTNGTEIVRLSHFKGTIGQFKTARGYFYSIAFSPNGKLSVTAIGTNVQIWDISSGKEVIRFVHQGSANSALFSPDGKQLVTASNDKTARVWDIASGKEVVRFDHESYVQSASFSPDGKRVVTRSEDIAQVWDVASQKTIARFRHGTSINSALFSPDGKQVLTAGKDGVAQVWDVASQTEIARFKHDGSVSPALFSPDGKQLVTASNDKTARVWDIASGKEVVRFDHKRYVQSASFSPDGKRVVTTSGYGDYDHVTQVWDVASQTEIARFKHLRTVSSATFSPDGKQVAAIGYEGIDQVAQVWDIASGKEVAHFESGKVVFSASFSSDGKEVVTASNDKTARVWDIASGKEISRFDHEFSNTVDSASFSPNGKQVVTRSDHLFSSNRSAKIWDVTSGKEVARFTPKGSVTSASFSPDGKWLVIASDDNALNLCDVSNMGVVASFGHKDPQESIAFYSASFAPNGKLVLTISGKKYSSDRSAQIWDVSKGKEVRRFVHGQSVISASFSPDGKQVVTMGRDNTVRVWDVSTGKTVARLVHEKTVTSASFSPNGKQVVTASSDKTVRVWDVSTGKEVARLLHEKDLHFALFSPNGKQVVTVSGGDNGDDVARVWKIDIPQFETVAHLRARAREQIDLRVSDTATPKTTTSIP